MMNEIKKSTQLFNQVTALHRAVAFKAFSGSGLFAGQYHILEVIHSNQNATQQTIATMMNVSPASVTNSVHRLEKKGLVERETSEKDLRVNHLSLTPKGEKTLEVFHEKFSLINDEMFVNFSQEDLQTMNQYLEKIVDNLTDISKRTIVSN